MNRRRLSLITLLCILFSGCCCGARSPAHVKVVDSRSIPVSGAVIRARSMSMVCPFGSGVAVTDHNGIATFIAGQNYSKKFSTVFAMLILHKDFMPVRIVKDVHSTPEIVLTKRGRGHPIEGLLLNSRDDNYMCPTFSDDYLYGLSPDAKSAVRRTWMNAVQSEQKRPSEFK